MLLDAAEYLTVARREESIVADSDKPVREYVLGEQIQEGVNLRGHDAMLPAFPVHLVIVGDLRACHVQACLSRLPAQYSECADGRTDSSPTYGEWTSYL